MLADCKAQEQLAKDTLVEFDEQYTDVLNDGNVNDILRTLLEKQETEHSVSDIDITMF